MQTREREREKERREEQTYARKEREKMKQTPCGFVQHLLVLFTVQETYTRWSNFPHLTRKSIKCRQTTTTAETSTIPEKSEREGNKNTWHLFFFSFQIIFTKDLAILLCEYLSDWKWLSKMPWTCIIGCGEWSANDRIACWFLTRNRRTRRNNISIGLRRYRTCLSFFWESTTCCGIQFSFRWLPMKITTNRPSCTKMIVRCWWTKTCCRRFILFHSLTF